jgi:hypothetical protein
MGAKYMECSSKEWIGVEEIFDAAIVDAVQAGEEMEARMRGVHSPEEGRGSGASKATGSSGKSSKRRRGGKGCRIL